ncbi:MAG: hypothetical protein WBC77_08980, partial [Candidatus Zixiibacteriota bacterium]
FCSKTDSGTSEIDRPSPVIIAPEIFTEASRINNPDLSSPHLFRPKWTVLIDEVEVIRQKKRPETTPTSSTKPV